MKNDLFVIVKYVIDTSDVEVIDNTPMTRVEASSLVAKLNGGLLSAEDQIAYDGMAVRYTYSPNIT